MSHIIDQIHALQACIADHVTIVLATKYATVPQIGQISEAFPSLIFGENRVNHGAEKQSAYPTISNPWHFIGHLQRNKVKRVIQDYDLIHSVDSMRLLTEIQSASLSLNQKTPVLLQFNPLKESTKHGFDASDLTEILDHTAELTHVSIQGLMCMAPFTSDQSVIKKTFKKTKQLYDILKQDGLPLEYLSMGMSNDFQLAIDEGSNMIRVGSFVFK